MPLIAVLLGAYVTPEDEFEFSTSAFLQRLQERYPSQLWGQHKLQDSLVRWLTEQPSREAAIEQVSGAGARALTKSARAEFIPNIVLTPVVKCIV